jgi:IclR family transcriptional regulator, pca regulon regulatory protein
MRAVPTLRDGRYSQSLERGLAILACFSAERLLLGIAEIADEVGMRRSTTHRYVMTLVALGYLEQGAKRKYRLSLGVTDLGMSALSTTGLREHSRPLLQELRERSGYTVSLVVLDGVEVVYVDRARSFRRTQSLDGLGPGSRLPAYCTAMGKLLLAHLPLGEQQKLFAEMTLLKCGPSTITSKRGLRVELERVREDGLAVDDEEFAAGHLAVAVGVRDEAGEVVAALGMSGDASMISLADLVGQLPPHLISTADRISGQLGYRRDDER